MAARKIIKGISKLTGKNVKSDKLKKLEKEYGTKAQAGETAREFQSRMNQRDAIKEFGGSPTGQNKNQSFMQMLERMPLKQRRAEIRELQAEGMTVPKKILDKANMEKVNGKLVIKKKMMGGGMPMKKKMMSKGGSTSGTMKKKMMSAGGNMKKKGYAAGGMPMAKDPKTGKMVPKFAMDGKGKMMKGGMPKKKGYAAGGMSKKKGYAAGGRVTMKRSTARGK